MIKLKLLNNLLINFLITLFITYVLSNQNCFYIILVLSYISIKFISRNYFMLENNEINDTFFSIIVAAKNEEKNILDSVRYLSEINYNNDMYEVIIVNDNSTDNTLKILEESKLPKNFKIVNRERNDGFVAGVLNDGISKISDKSQVIGVIDADTIPSKYILNIVKKYYDCNFKGCVQPQEWHYNCKSSILTMAQHFLCVYENFDNLENKNFKVGHFIHRDVFKDNRYDECSILEDVNFSNAIKKKKVDIIQINDVLVFRKFHDSMMSVYSQQYRYQLGTLMNAYSNKVYFSEMTIPLIIFFNVVLYPINGFEIFYRLNLLILYLIYNLIDNGIDRHYLKSLNSAIKNCPESLEESIYFYKTHGHIIEIFNSTIFAYFILVLRLLPFFKLPLGNERIVWNRFKNEH